MKTDPSAVTFCFDNSWKNYAPASTYTAESPRRCRQPEVITLDEQTIRLLQLNFNNLDLRLIAEQLSGSAPIEGACPIATAYAGHQYGGFVRLGDGRAILLGEHVTASGERFDIQLKGSGRTSFSRRGDGLATLPTMLKEFITSSAMHSLAVPTTTPLALISTGDVVARERDYPGAVLVRIAKSHIRVGHFEYLAAFCSASDQKQFFDYCLDRHFPELKALECKVTEFLRLVCLRYLRLIPKWQGLGFVHGVMNTDNFLISGETIDYGPCAFMDNHTPTHPYSSIDEMGRYCYQMQPWVACWNLAKLADSLASLARSEEYRSLKETISWFRGALMDAISDEFRTKLGLTSSDHESKKLVTDLLQLIEEHHDFTQIFCELGLSILAQAPSNSPIHSSKFKGWYQRWQKRLSTEGRSSADVVSQMMAVNPWIIPRNHIVEDLAKQSEKLDRHQLAQKIQQLLAAFSSAYDYSKIDEKYFRAPKPEELVLTTFCGT